MPFLALNGTELKQFILKKIEEKLDATGEFTNHIAYPWIKYDFLIRILAVPQQQIGDDPKIQGKGDGEERDLGVPV